MNDNIEEIQDQKIIFSSGEFVELSAGRRSGEIRRAYQELINNVKDRGELSNEQSRDV